MNPAVYSDTAQRRVLGIFCDLVRARELLADLAWKELRVRYRYAAMGFLWAVLEPVALMLILTFVFTLVFRQKGALLGGAADRPFAVVLLCGLIFWQFLATAVTSGTRSFIDGQNLVNKVYFPREVIPLASVITCLVNLLIGFAMLLVLHVVLGGQAGLGLLWFAPVFAIQFVLVTGAVLLLACLNVFFRDVGYMAGVAILFGFYATPIFYTLDLVRRIAPEHPWLVRCYLLNPMAQLVHAYREILFENRMPDPGLLLWPCCAAALALAAGVIVVRRYGPYLADYL